MVVRSATLQSRNMVNHFLTTRHFLFASKKKGEGAC